MVNTDNTKDWNIITLTEMIDYILETYHQPLKDNLQSMLDTNDKLIRVHGERHPEFIQIRQVLGNFVDDMTQHLYKEEQMLFPLIKEIDYCHRNSLIIEDSHCGSVANPIGQMEYEHEIFDKYLSEIRELTNNFILPDDACKTYAGFFEKLQWLETETLKHAGLENDFLHKRAISYESELV